MADHVLLVAGYASRAEAVSDLRAVVAIGADVVGTGLLHRSSNGAAQIEQGGGGTLAYATGTGAALGFVLGLTTPLPWLGLLLGGGIGAAIGHQVRFREVNGLAEALAPDFVLTPGEDGSWALVAIVRDTAVDRATGELALALRSATYLVGEGPLRKFARTLTRGNPAWEDPDANS